MCGVMHAWLARYTSVATSLQTTCRTAPPDFFAMVTVLIQPGKWDGAFLRKKLGRSIPSG
jgi:hypothetical protein